jgi:DNA mismatch repair ATPase MutS
MFFEEHTPEQIGFNTIKSWLEPLCPYGRRELARIKPILNLRLLQETWQLVDHLRGLLAENKLTGLETNLHRIREIHGIAFRSLRDHPLEDYDFFLLKEWLLICQELEAFLAELRLPPRLRLYPLWDLKTSLSIGQEGRSFFLADAYSPALAEKRNDQHRNQAALAILRQQQREQVSQESCLTFNFQGVARVSKLEGERLESIRGRRDLLMAAESFTEVEFRLRDTPEMMALERKTLALEDEVRQEEYLVRVQLSQVVARCYRLIVANCRRLGQLDLLLAMARLARLVDGKVPTLTAQNVLTFQGLVHPVVSRDLVREGLEFQPHHLNLGSPPVTIITGANMGGKSVTLRAVGLAVAMAQHGMLPAVEAMNFCPRNFIYYSRHTEAGDGLSAFGTEIHSLAQVLPLREEQGLYLLDEPGRSTNPQEGSALVQAIIAWLLVGRSVTVLATHFPEVVKCTACQHLQVAGLTTSDAALAEELAKGPQELRRLMNYRLVTAGEPAQQALKVAAFLGLEPEILARATAILVHRQGG